MNTTARPASLESLEPRTLYSTGFWSAGLIDDRVTTGASVYVEDGLVEDSGHVGGTRTYDDGSSYGSVTATEWTGLGFDDKGGLRVDHRDGRFVQSSELGSAFGAQRGYPAGWFLGVGNRLAIGQFGLTIPKPDDAAIADLEGHWAVNGLHLERKAHRDESFDGLFGTATVSGTGVSGEWSRRRQGELQTTAFAGTVQSVTPSGVIHFAGTDLHDVVGYLGRDKAAAVWAELSSGDDELSFGAAVRRGADFTVGAAAGVYRVALVLPDEINDVHFGSSVVVLDLRLELRSDGTYSAVDLGDSDAGTMTPRFQGNWSLNRDEITTSAPGGLITRWVLSSNGSTLLPMSITESDGTVRALAGLGSRVRPGDPAASSPPVSLVGYDDSGRHTIYERSHDDIWRRADLQLRAGGPPIVGRVESWTSTRDGLVHAAARSAESVILYTRAPSGTWSRRNLTAEIPGAVPITSELAVFVDADGRAGIAGLDAAGDLVLYREPSSGTTWTFTNLTDTYVVPSGRQMPTIVGGITCYVTPWNGLNIAGLDDHGHIQAVWTAPALNGEWRLSDLSTDTGGSALAGSLTVYVAPWGGINLSGLDDAGAVRVTWWAPGLDSWREDDLSGTAGAPAFTAGSVTSYVNPWGGLNVAGLDAQGDVQILWWAPGLDRWQVSRMTSSSDPSLRPTGSLRAVTAPDGRTTVFGANQVGEIVALTFEIGAARWTTQNLSAIAPDY